MTRRVIRKADELLALMKDGWELSQSTTMSGGYWVQKGNAVFTVASPAARRLYGAGLINAHYSFPFARYTLVEKP